MLEGLQHIHDKGFAHRQLDLDNIMIEDATNIVKIVGFGFSCSSSGRPTTQGDKGSGFNTTIKGTPAYMAPEMLKHQPYHGPTVDMFAMAVILFIMVLGRNPFLEANMRKDRYYQTLVNNPEQYWSYIKKTSNTTPPISLSSEFISLVTSMLQEQSSQRPSLEQVLSHAWFQSGEASAT